MIIMVNKDNKRVITEHDSAILKKLCCDAANSKSGISIWLSRLNSLLKNADVVSSGKISPDRVTINSEIALQDNISCEVVIIVLVLPAGAFKKVEGEFDEFEVPVLSPLGLSVLGRKVGDTIAGRINIGEMIYQPEAEGRVNDNSLRA